ncbi:nucleoside recognition domain-containing protein [Domibacillus epiphyticus]|uniref:Spore maturation protein n=1 Tax=Domibacillus epiphyticus TaxID=1714355 RepID=A0A1V2A4G7_9BACI|nr:nucleoside recognition domain-containing protein [Domibacillus epiphyticus]OMP65895.1 spore maturation protein [Domibacillus epiphyticus]
MVSAAFAFLLLSGFVFAAVNGTMAEVNEALFQSMEQSVQLAISLAGVILFWTGVMKTAEAAGIVSWLAHIVQPLLSRLFPEIPRDHPVFGFIASNMAANFFGLGNAATPIGLKTMRELRQINDDRDTASRSMITFLALNTAGVTLIPTTVIALGISHGAKNPADIILPAFLATVMSACFAIVIDRYYARKRNR